MPTQALGVGVVTNCHAMVANVNNSRAKATTSKKATKMDGIYTPDPKLSKIKSKIVVCESNKTDMARKKAVNKGTNNEIVQFEEEGEIIQMEIDDGGATAAEFSSEGDCYQNDGSQNDNSSESEQSEQSDNYESEAESGEIHNTETDPEETNESFIETCKNTASLKVKKRKKNSNRHSVEDQLSSMSNTLTVMKELLMKNGITDLPEGNQNQSTKGKALERQTNLSESDTTIYQNALEKVDSGDIVVDAEITFKNRESSSSEEGKIDTSDEMMEIDCNNFIAECTAQANRCKRPYPGEQEPDPKEAADNVIREAEAAKIRMLPTPGNCYNVIDYDKYDKCYNGITANQHSPIVDENYVAIGGHIDGTLCDKIRRGEYVDFLLLLPRDHLSSSDEGKLELIFRGGQTYFVPADKDGPNITSFYKWEQAFRTFSNIYLKEHPDRATELIQNNHIICSASTTYTWENVYQYDREFRTHLASFPDRSWSIILQQAWSMCLRDRINFNHNGNSNVHISGGQNRGSKKEICQRFNRGLCTTGQNCQYDHRCLECGKFGHGVHICRHKTQTQTMNQQMTGSSMQGGTAVPVVTMSSK